jgi:hypothetical protein
LEVLLLAGGGGGGTDLAIGVCAPLLTGYGPYDIVFRLVDRPFEYEDEVGGDGLEFAISWAG